MQTPKAQRVKALFLELEDLSPTEREQRLERSSDPEVAEQVRALFSAAGGTDPFFAGPGPLERAPLVANHPDRTGSRIGAYLLDSLLGRGGMGEVWSARRADGAFEQHVAIKLLTAGVHDPDAVARFQAERGILARLSHPGIAALYDGGSLDDGTPYFVMERIDGETVDRHCDQQSLSVDERLALFLQVCDALAHAHDAGIVHRDIKPANVLVSGSGQVKLLDFGIAKVLGRRDWIASFQTATGKTPMTPAYASPEQLRGGEVGAPSDVYSLGVLLYELLTGLLPYESDPDSHVAHALAICEGTIPPPSLRFGSKPAATAPDRTTAAQARQTTVSGAHRRIRGDLDLIALMALRKEPHRRYADAGELSADLRRHLRNYPVHARPDSRSYRAARYAQRHRGAFRIAAASLLALGTVGTIAFRLSERSHVQSATIAADQEKFSSLHAVLMQLYREADPWSPQAKQATRRGLDLAVEPLREGLVSDPAERARLHHAAGIAYLRLELVAEAAELLEVAVADRRRLHPEGHPDLAESLTSLGLALSRNPLGDRQRGREILEEALALSRKLEGPNSIPVARIRLALGRGGHATGSGGAESEEHFEAAVRILQQAGSVEGEEYGKALLDKGELLAVYKNRVPEAIACYRQAMEIWLELYGEDHPAFAKTADGLGLLLYSKGDKQEGIAYLRKALRIHRRVYGDQGHSTLAWSLLNLGGALAHVDDPEGAPLLMEAKRQFLKLPTTEPMQLRHMLNKVAEGLLRLDDSQAIEALEASFELAGQRGGSTLQLVEHRRRLVDALAHFGDIERAIQQQRLSVEALSDARGTDQGRLERAQARLRELERSQR